MNDPDSQSLASIRYLNEIKPPADMLIPALINALSNKDARVRIKVAELLGAYKKEAASAVPALLAALKDEDQMVRCFAAISLGEIESKVDSVVDALYIALNDKKGNEHYVRAEAALAIAKIVGPNDREKILELDDKLREIANDAVRAGMPFNFVNRTRILFQRLMGF